MYTFRAEIAVAQNSDRSYFGFVYSKEPQKIPLTHTNCLSEEMATQLTEKLYFDLCPEDDLKAVVRFFVSDGFAVPFEIAFGDTDKKALAELYENSVAEDDAGYIQCTVGFILDETAGFLEKLPGKEDEEREAYELTLIFHRISEIVRFLPLIGSHLTHADIDMYKFKDTYRIFMRNLTPKVIATIANTASEYDITCAKGEMMDVYKEHAEHFTKPQVLQLVREW